MTQETQVSSRMAKVLSELYRDIETVPKSGYNDFNNYSYVTEPDLVNLIRPKLAEKGIFLFPSVVSQEVLTGLGTANKPKMLTLVTMEFTLKDSETGEEFTCKAQGQGYDNQDKGVYKAITGATKYFLYKLFLIAAGDEPEADDYSYDDTTVTKSTASSSFDKQPSDKQVEYLIDLLYEYSEVLGVEPQKGIPATLKAYEIDVDIEFDDVDELHEYLKNHLTVDEVSVSIETLLLSMEK